MKRQRERCRRVQIPILPPVSNPARHLAHEERLGVPGLDGWSVGYGRKTSLPYYPAMSFTKRCTETSAICVR